MTINELLSLGYKKYKDEENIEVKNGYSLSFEDLRIDIDSDDENSYVEADICDLSDDWTPIGRIHKKNKKKLPERIIRYCIWVISLSGMAYICYHTISDLYRE
jgi:hypothetical protein